MHKYITNVTGKVKPLFAAQEDVGSIIEEILSILMSLIGNCGDKPTVADLVAGGGRFGTFQLNNALRKAGIPPLFARGRAIKKAMIEEAKNSEVEAQEFLAQCCQ